MSTNDELGGIWPLMLSGYDDFSWELCHDLYYTCEPPWVQCVNLAHRIRERKQERTKMVIGSLRLLFLQEPLGLIEPLWQETPMGCFVVTVKRVRRFNVKHVVCTVKLSKASSAFSHGTVIQTWVLPAWHWHWCPFSSYKLQHNKTRTWKDESDFKYVQGQIVNLLM